MVAAPYAASLVLTAGGGGPQAYARIRASRAASKKKFEREQAVEKAGAFGKLLGGVLGGALANAPRVGVW